MTLNCVLRIVPVQAGGCYTHDSHLPCLGLAEETEAWEKASGSLSWTGPFLPFFSGKTGQKETGFPSSQWPWSWVIQSFSPFPLSHKNTHNGRIEDWLVNILCASCCSGKKNTGLCKDTCSKSLWFRAVCILHLHLPELARPPRAQRNQFCSLRASSTHSWLNLALCCTKTYSSAQPGKAAKDLGDPFWALLLLCRGAWATRWLPTCRTGRMDWDILCLLGTAWRLIHTWGLKGRDTYIPCIHAQHTYAEI